MPEAARKRDIQELLAKLEGIVAMIMESRVEIYNRIDGLNERMDKRLNKVDHDIADLRRELDG